MTINSQLVDAGYAALLSLDNGRSTGSGFRIENNKYIYLVTAKHVLYDEYDKIRCESLVISFQTLMGNEHGIETVEILDIDEAEVFYSIKDDLAIILLTDKLSEGLDYTYKDYVTVYTPGIINTRFISNEHMKVSNQIKIGNDIFLLGYPTSLFFQNMQSFDIRKPLLRKGIVAGINSEGNTFIIDCPAYYGNSGAPILEVCESGILKLIGFVSRYVPFIVEWKNSREAVINNEYLNSGYSVCVSTDAILVLIEKSQN